MDGIHPFDVFSKYCPSRVTLEHVTGRWGSLTLGSLYEGSLRFNELRRRVDGVSEKMLSQTLHALERDGLVHREAQHTNPPRVDYELTPLGRAVAERLIGLIDLVEARMPEVIASRERYDEARERGRARLTGQEPTLPGQTEAPGEAEVRGGR
ncbi:helix-turn-helix domain-containing protein [Streptomyces sp. NPDC051907]|uniref:winged helix-turn-helix transcriptional regulator n=1 Tax=Streptomyces sp. NPDC051907 TaxID=3155284 RepID=UPI003430F4EE